MLANTELLLHTELQCVRMDPIIMHLHVNTYMMESTHASSNVVTFCSAMHIGTDKATCVFYVFVRHNAVTMTTSCHH